MRSYLLLIAVVVAILIAGCGGGSSNTSSSVVVDGGTIRGTLSNLPLAQTRGTETLTVQVDGTDITTTVEPGKEFVLNGVPAGLKTLNIENEKYGKAIVVQVGSKEITEMGEVAVLDAGKISGVITDADTTKPIAEAVVTVTEAIATTTATSNAMPHPVRVKRTGPDGGYTLRGILPGSYVVNIAVRGYTSASMIVDVVAQTVSTCSIALNKAAITTSDTGTLKGTVSLESDGTVTPLAGALVRLRPVETSDEDSLNQPLPAMLYQVAADSNRPVKIDPVTGNIDSIQECPRELIAYTNETGSYVIENIPAGSYRAKAVSPGMDVKGAAVTVVITANGGIVQDFTLTLKKINGIEITGTVTDSTSNKPIAKAGVRCILSQPITVRRQTMKRNRQTYEMKTASGDGLVIKPNATGNLDGDSMVIYAITDESGKYKVISPAVSGIAVNAIGYTPQEKTITANTSPQVIDFAMVPLQVGTITGVVKTVGGVGIAEVKIFADYPTLYADASGSNDAAITNLGQPESRATITDSEGKFSIKTLPGKVTLYVKKEGFQTLQQTVDVTADTPVSLEIILKALKFGKIVGTVKDSVNIPIPNAVVRRGGIYYTLDLAGTAPVHLPGSSIAPNITAPGETKTDAEGKFTFEDLPLGELTLTCMVPGYEISYLTVTVTDLLPARADFILKKLPLPTTVYGTVTDSNKKPIVGAVVSAADLYYITSNDTTTNRFMEPLPPANNWVTKTDVNGKYSLSVPAWVTKINVSAPGYVISVNPVTLVAGSDKVLDVTLALKQVN